MNDKRIKRLELIIDSLKKELLPDRKNQYEIMSKTYKRMIEELKIKAR